MNRLLIEYTVFYKINGEPKEVGKIRGISALSTMFVMSSLAPEIKAFKEKYNIIDFRPEFLYISYDGNG